MDGERIQQLVYLIPENPIPQTFNLDLPERHTNECCNEKSIKVLADINTNDEFKNDISGFVDSFDDVVSAAQYKLYKFNEAINDFELTATITDQTYGLFSAYGFFVNDLNEKFIRLELNWKQVLTLHGEGGYLIKCEYTSSLGGSANKEYGAFCLSQYTANRANGTVKLEWYNSNVLGRNDDDTKWRDFGNNDFYFSVRVPGWFGFPGFTYEDEFIRYFTGYEQWVAMKQKPEYELFIKPIPINIHNFLRTDALQSDRLFITDYNTNAPERIIKKQVIKDGEYRPDYTDRKLQSLVFPVAVQFKQAFNNLDKKICN